MNWGLLLLRRMEWTNEWNTERLEAAGYKRMMMSYMYSKGGVRFDGGGVERNGCAIDDDDDGRGGD